MVGMMVKMMVKTMEGMVLIRLSLLAGGRGQGVGTEISWCGVCWEVLVPLLPW